MQKIDIETLYLQHKLQIYQMVWHFIEKKQLSKREFDDLLGQANLFFMVAAHRYINKDKAKFTTWLYWQIWGRLTFHHENELRELEKIHKPRERVDKPSGSIRPPIDWWDELSTDSRILIGYVCTGELDLSKAIKRTRPSIKVVFRFLRDLGWSRKRINKCLRNIGKLLK